MPRKDPLFPGMPPPLPHPSLPSAVPPAPLLQPGGGVVVGAVGGQWRMGDRDSIVAGGSRRERQVRSVSHVMGVGSIYLHAAVGGVCFHLAVAAATAQWWKSTRNASLLLRCLWSLVDR